MTQEQFLDEIALKCSEITHLSIQHILKKIYNENNPFDYNDAKELLTNYKNYHLYLNDYAGTIYSRYASSVNEIYIQMCEFLDVDVDNKYTLEYTIMKLEKQTPELLLGLTDSDIQKQTIIHFDEKIDAIHESTHYNENLAQFQPRVEKLIQNIALVKNTLHYS